MYLDFYQPKENTHKSLNSYQQRRVNWNIASRVENFNKTSTGQGHNVELQIIMDNGTQYMFAVINDVLLTVNPDLFNLFIQC